MIVPVPVSTLSHKHANWHCVHWNAQVGKCECCCWCYCSAVFIRSCVCFDWIFHGNTIKLHKRAAKCHSSFTAHPHLFSIPPYTYPSAYPQFAFSIICNSISCSGSSWYSISPHSWHHLPFSFWLRNSDAIVLSSSYRMTDSKQFRLRVEGLFPSLAYSHFIYSIWNELGRVSKRRATKTSRGWSFFSPVCMQCICSTAGACCHIIKYLTIIAVLCTMRLLLCLNTSHFIRPQFKSNLLIFVRIFSNVTFLGRFSLYGIRLNWFYKPSFGEWNVILIVLSTYRLPFCFSSCWMAFGCS